MLSKWKEVRLGDYISIKSGLAYKGSKIGMGSALLLGMGCVSYKEKFVDSGARPYDGDDVDDSFCVNPGDIVLATRQQSDNLPILAMPAVIPDYLNSKKIIFGTNLYKVDNHSEISNRFLFWLLKHQHYVNYIAGIKSGTAVQMVTKKNVENYKFLCPPKFEREKIADILWTYDKAVENNNKRIKILEQMAENLYKEWFVRFRFPGHEDVEFEGGIPKEWEIIKLCDVTNIKAGGDKPEECYEYPSEQYKVPVYSNGIDNDGLYGYTNQAVIIDNSITISARGTVGFVCLRRTPFVPIVRLLAITPKSDDNLVYYLFYNLKYDGIIGNGTSQQQITVPMVNRKRVILPDDVLIKKYASVTKEIWDEIDIIKYKNGNLIKQRDLLLPRLMSGKLQVK